MSDDQLRETLQAEYFYLQGVIEEFDSRALTIKAWSISFSLAAIAGAFASQAYLVFLVAFVSALLFWFLEATWKSFQLGYYQRAEAIERHFQGEAAPIAPLQIGATWFRHWSVRRLDAMGADDAVAACRASARGGSAHRRVAVRADGTGHRARIATRCAGPQRGPARFGFFTRSVSRSAWRSAERAAPRRRASERNGQGGLPLRGRSLGLHGDRVVAARLRATGNRDEGGEEDGDKDGFVLHGGRGLQSDWSAAKSAPAPRGPPMTWVKPAPSGKHRRDSVRAVKPQRAHTPRLASVRAGA